MTEILGTVATVERPESERRQRYFKAKVLKFNRKLNSLGEKALQPENFKALMAEGRTLLVFMAIDCVMRERWEI